MDTASASPGKAVGLAIYSALAAAIHKLATAVRHDADILTCDAHFKDLERVIYIDKKD
ncbi:type II toxin-antitoxin system VapC family toxin [Rhizobium leguminosarum]|uniref:type II toxin-antitoxin system VapC family toxin n=1 Tax=Rhizobium leguminosarum TaxID=384 RepID=UPI00144290C1|nr:type II toxin-antitoxin system VapC family toxin [Rhizobium leguminosarum]NKL80351.1 type II toxin-antitoxin system VapC family toxin [Rhizobium leguminosarum bv. viciae]